LVPFVWLSQKEEVALLVEHIINLRDCLAKAREFDIYFPAKTRNFTLCPVEEDGPEKKLSSA
jgi:hypothetical protein